MGLGTSNIAPAYLVFLVSKFSPPKNNHPPRNFVLITLLSRPLTNNSAKKKVTELSRVGDSGENQTITGGACSDFACVLVRKPAAAVKRAYTV